jgi:hypothetical protein
MNRDPLPRADGDFDAWQAVFIGYLNLNGVPLGLTPAQCAAPTAPQAAWTADYAASLNPAAATPAVTAQKREARAALEAVLRPLVREIQALPTTTDEQRVAMGLHVHATGHAPAPVPSTARLATVDTSRRLQHVVHFRDSASPHSKAKPAGVLGCEIWAKVGGPPPASVAELVYLATDTATPYLAEYDIAQAGETVYYWLRWVNTRGQTGPWSEVVNATTPG